MSEQKGIKEGPPIWVESLMNAEEWRERYRSGLPSSTVKEPVQYDPSYHKGGKWRAGMGSSLSKEEINRVNKEIESLRQFVISQQKLAV